MKMSQRSIQEINKRLDQLSNIEQNLASMTFQAPSNDVSPSIERRLLQIEERLAALEEKSVSALMNRRIRALEKKING